MKSTEMAVELASIADRINSLSTKAAQGFPMAPLATQVAADLFPSGVELRASQGKPLQGEQEGRWHYYLVMPVSWRPPEGGKRWIQNPTSGRWWDTGTNVHDNTKRGALAAGLRRLCEVI